LGVSPLTHACTRGEMRAPGIHLTTICACPWAPRGHATYSCKAHSRMTLKCHYHDAQGKRSVGMGGHRAHRPPTPCIRRRNIRDNRPRVRVRRPCKVSHKYPPLPLPPALPPNQGQGRGGCPTGCPATRLPGCSHPATGVPGCPAAQIHCPHAQPRGARARGAQEDTMGSSSWS
jgi:hypothetical protein